MQWVRLRSSAVFSVIAAVIGGCSHGAGFTAPVPISVTLAIGTVTVPRGGTPVVVPLSIISTSETASVNVINLPTDLAEDYSASDTNPSGTLKFTAGKLTPIGSYKPTVMVVSARETAMTTFTLIVNGAA